MHAAACSIPADAAGFPGQRLRDNGALTTCLVFVMILLTNTVCYLPL